ncbi:MAG: AI-2E family transporter [Anaerolineales bacterium]|nr:AI-2E family transporter [Anaerolineales bacterium]
MQSHKEIPPIMMSMIGFVLVGLALVLISWLREILTPIMLAFFMTALVLPSYFWLQKRNVKPGLALLILIGMLLLGGIAVGFLFVSSVNSLQDGLQFYLSDLTEKFADLQASFGLAGEIANGVGGGQLLGNVLAYFVATLLDVTTIFLFSAMLVAFFLLESPRFHKLLQTNLTDRPLLSQLPTAMQTTVAYFGIRTRLNFITGIGMTIWLLVLGVDYALLWGLLIFILSYVPYIGMLVAMIPPTILAFAEFDPIRAVLVVIGAFVMNVLIENILGPSYTGKRLSLSPSFVFISFFVWAWLLGPVGALLSMPITVTLMLTLNQYESTRWLANIIGRE